MESFKKIIPISFFGVILISVSALFLYYEMSAKVGYIRINKILGHDGNNFDDLSLITSIKNYEKDGLFSNYLISNRKGHPQQSYWGVPCYRKNEEEVIKEFKFKNGLDENISHEALVNDCFYTRSPPLPEIVYYIFYNLTGKDIRNLKFLALIFSIVSMLLLYNILRVFFDPWASSLTLSLIVFTRYYYVWMFNLYNVPLNTMLFFTSVLCVLKGKYKYSKYFLAVSTFLMAYTSNESIVALLIIAGAYPYIHKGRIDKRPILIVFVSSALSVLIYQIQKLLFFGSFSRLVEDFTGVYGERYKIDGDLLGVVEKLVSNIDYYVSTEVISITALIITLLVVPKTEKMKQHLIMFFIAASSFSLIFSKVAYFHVHVFYKHFIIFFSYTIALAIYYVMRGKKKTVKIVLVVSFFYGFWKNYNELMAYEILFNKEVIHSKVQGNKANNFLDVMVWQKAKAKNEFSFSWRYRLVDGIEPNWKYYFMHYGYPMYQDSIGEIDLYYLEPTEINYVAGIIHKNEVFTFRKSCELYTIDENYELKIVEHKNSMKPLKNKVKSRNGKIEEVSTEFMLPGWKFDSRVVMGVRFHCEVQDHFQFHEIRIK